jgi:multimeric flavodoxin WrbA
MIPTPSILIVNASLHGNSENSNTLVLLKLAEKELLRRGAKVTLVSPELVKFRLDKSEKDQSMYVLNTDEVISSLEAADGLLIGTGTHWGQSSSTLQKFVEDATPSEGTKAWLGKPVGIIASEHSTGGQTVASNLAATISNYGGFVVPQGWMVYSRAGQEAKKHGGDWAEDVWGPDDVRSICDNLLKYAAQRKAVELESWPIDEDPDSFHGQWVKGELPERRREPKKEPKQAANDLERWPRSLRFLKMLKVPWLVF